MENGVARRPGGRSARVRAAVLDAADSLLAEGAGPMTVRALAERSGVSEPTIYRRWRSVEGVVLEAAVRDLTATRPIQVTGNLRRDLTRWAENLEAGVATTAGLRFVGVVLDARLRPDAAEAVRSFLDQRVDQLQALLEADHAPAALTVEHLLDDILAPLYLRQIFGRPTSRAYARRLVARVLTEAGVT